MAQRREPMMHTGGTPRRRSITLVLVALLSLLAVAARMTPPVDAAPVATHATTDADPRSAAETDAACPDPTCPLRVAGANAGVKVGFGVGWGSPQHEATVTAEANVSVNHQFSWVAMEPSRGVWNFTQADAEHQFAVDHGMYQIGMHFAWDQQVLDDLPSWVLTVTDPVELRTVLAERAQAIFARYPDLDRIDVINEPFQTLGHELYANHFLQVLGPDYIYQLFQIVAAAAPPSVQLFVNEAGIEYQPQKADALVALVADLRARGARIDAVGLQSHMVVGEPNWPLYLHTMQRLAALGVIPFISELDIPVAPSVPDRAVVEARRYRQAAETCLAVPACDVIDTWGVADTESWLEGSLTPGLEPLLFDAQYRPKPAYDAVHAALRGGRIDPATLHRSTDLQLTSGHTTARDDLECRPVGELTETGLPQLSSVVHTFLAGNPMRLPLDGTLWWDAAVPAGGSITYERDVRIDLAEVARRYVAETAYPAVGLGGYPTLAPTVWIRLATGEVTVDHPTPEGATAVRNPSVSIGGPGAPTAVVTATGATFRLPGVSGDSRSPTPDLTVHSRWTADLPTSSTPVTVRQRSPEVAFDLTIDLGVVVNGASVAGTVSGAMHCTAAGALPVAVTQVVPAVVEPGPTTTTTTTSTPATTAGAATATRATPAFAG